MERVHQLADSFFWNVAAMRTCDCNIRLTFIENCTIPVNLNPVRRTSAKTPNSHKRDSDGIPVTNYREWDVPFEEEFWREHTNLLVKAGVDRSPIAFERPISRHFGSRFGPRFYVG
jgi:hypothetical protein